ncbi:50S ribosomal protein L13 [candidate division WOR-1 bacterium RIFOXYA12_FULL_43_27]|uniref:Large ribosomal subunit protein uL13 n=1 Tax=candidate division WOR-1 bacterium RIFOXYC2_FULL_46_14 TaxID=1802587 RepID=A0A1F4U5Q0_UNCSA|nr:MAG: 50S ribosomal protein L13 [candidate division WOR-1 bacterium RIFOXYA12_FULL_43_27]OGC20421.1 MAG: 50S ribosomal protein L13 [candidate division WOR-1 bacterium RIFOXYB2_FULL_46_45]OGC31842.1 MAG: 50S ribosomal protein L13 [candidate division WOR-1 bacterium RIFOXYA2_FULL_46_56]OGC40266.1 MAG: 50S ribosomal protein L13 [candidate division WOR-1 bacterium RIFOXYC2_FULL_46_14]
MKRNKTFLLKHSDIKKGNQVIDAKGIVLGRLAVIVAGILRGKNKVTFTPHMDGGDSVTVINAGAVTVTGKKEKGKTYFSHSGYPGGDKLFNFEVMIKKNPARVIRQAVSGMLPKGRLGRAIMRNLTIKA